MQDSKGFLESEHVSVLAANQDLQVNVALCCIYLHFVVRTVYQLVSSCASLFCNLPLALAEQVHHLLPLSKASHTTDACSKTVYQQLCMCTHTCTNRKLVRMVQTSVETLREQVKLLRSQRQRAVVLAHLPALRPEAQAHAHGKGPPPGCAALDLARRLQLEPAQTPKVGTAAASHDCVSN